MAIFDGAISLSRREELADFLSGYETRRRDLQDAAIKIAIFHAGQGQKAKMKKDPKKPCICKNLEKSQLRGPFLKGFPWFI